MDSVIIQIHHYRTETRIRRTLFYVGILYIRITYNLKLPKVAEIISNITDVAECETLN